VLFLTKIKFFSGKESNKVKGDKKFSKIDLLTTCQQKYLHKGADLKGKILNLKSLIKFSFFLLTSRTAAKNCCVVKFRHVEKN